MRSWKHAHLHRIGAALRRRSLALSVPWARACRQVVAHRHAVTIEQHRAHLSSSEASHLESEVGAHARDAAAQSRMSDDEDRDEDTIELSLTPECALALSQAAEEKHAEASPAPPPAHSPAMQIWNPGHQRVAQLSRWALVLAASVLGIAIGIALGLAMHPVPHLRTTSIKVPISTPSPVTPSAESRQPTVRFRNPFDRSEVFEFPPGTSAEEARQSAAAVLLQRARDRRGAEGAKSNGPTGTADERAHVARNSEARRM
jgi:hypothetical protein